jgi:flavin-dependent thymidylate synthase
VKVVLAGYNVDAEVLSELKNRMDVTPETLSASYARISRDPRPVNELRKTAREEVEKARRSNSTIIFKMGHHSVAEHAVFNFDILDVSRLALEEIEKFRLCSYTEKSQRYQKLEGNFLLPEEIKSTAHENEFLDVIAGQNVFYKELMEKGIEPEDARYVTPMATYGQLGMTINARNLELLVRRFASSRLAEVRRLGEEIYQQVVKIAPSIILFTSASELDQKTYPELKVAARRWWERKRKSGPMCSLVDCTKKADLKLVAVLLHTSSRVSFQNCMRIAKDLRRKERMELVKKANRYLEFYDALLREYEHISLTYDLILSSGCFAQMKRHRMATITGQDYEPDLGITLPPKIKAVGGERMFLKIIADAETLYHKLEKEGIAAAPYILTGAHRRRILMTVNARELYHISRLREDRHAQWDIQQLAGQMTGAANKAMPLTMLLIGGKDKYPKVYREVYGAGPKVLPPQE